MSEKNAKDTTPNSSPTHGAPDTHKKTISIWPTLISLAALIIALASAFYSFNLTGRLSSFQEKSTTLQSQISNLKTFSDQQHADLQTTQSNIKSLIEKHLAQQDWQFSELHYLIQAANWQVTFLKNDKMALAMLTEALKKANALNTPSLSPLINALHNDVSALNAMTPVNTSEILLTLSSINQQLPQIPLIKKVKSKQAPPSNTEQTKKNIWQRGLETGLSAIKNAVVIRRNQFLSPALLKPEEHSYLVDNLQLQLGIAQWALLNHKPKLFTQSIMTAQQWVKMYFNTNALGTKHVLNLLEPLSTLNVAPEFPDISDSLTAINYIINASTKE